nr:mucin-2-like isoform X2 [Dermacentor andersoni]
MAEATQQCSYVSCIKSFGRPILPPLMTNEKRLLMRHFKALACEREAARAKRKKEAFLHTLCEADLELDHSEDSSLDGAHTAPPSLAADSGACLTLPAVTSLGRDVRWAVSDTPETGSSATLVPSSSDSEASGTSTADSVGSRHDEVAGHQKDGTRLSPKKDLVPGNQVGQTEVPVTLTEATPAMSLTATTPKQYLEAAPTTMPMIMPMTLLEVTTEMTLTTKQVAPATTPTTMPMTMPPKTPVMMPMTAQLVSAATSTTIPMTILSKEPVMTATTQMTSASAVTSTTMPITMLPNESAMTATTQVTSASAVASTTMPLTTLLEEPVMTATMQVTSAATSTVMPMTMLPKESVMTATTQMTSTSGAAPTTMPMTMPHKTPVMTAVATQTSATKPMTMPMIISPKMPVTTQGTSAATLTTMAVTTPLSSPIREECFSTKVSVPSLCRSRSFVVESPSLAQLLLRGLNRDGRNSMNGTDAKIVQPCNSPTKDSFYVNPRSSERNMYAARVGEQTRKTKGLNISKTFIKADRKVNCSSVISQSTDDTTDESSHRLGGDVQPQRNSVCEPVGEQHDLASCRSDPDIHARADENTENTRGSPPIVKPTALRVPASPDRIEQAPTLLGKCHSVDACFISRVFSDTLKSFARTNHLPTHETPDGSFNIPFDNSSKVTGRVVPWTSSILDVVAAAKDPAASVKDSAANNTLHNIPNVPGDDSAEETVVDDVFTDALDDKWAELSSASLPGFFTKDSAATAYTLPMFGKTFLSDWGRGDASFVPASPSSNKHSICSSISSVRSSFDAERDVLALTLNSSGDVEEDEEQYEGVDEHHDDQANSSAELGGSLESSGSSLDESSASSGSEHLNAGRTQGSLVTAFTCTRRTSSSTKLGSRNLNRQAAIGYNSGVQQALLRGRYLLWRRGCDVQSLDQRMTADDMVAAHELKLQTLCQTLALDYARVNQSGFSVLREEAVSIALGGEEKSCTDDDTPLEAQTAGSILPPSADGHSPCGRNSSDHTSLPADLSMLRHSDVDHSRVDSSLASTSIHLDLLSETRQSLHPRWRRCFDRLTAMARGHLTRRLMKTHRVQSIIQTIKDTLECALRLHGEPHIRSGLVTPQDVELHQRLITQLTSACYELHDVFFNIPVAERMQLIAQLRSQKARPPVRITKGCMEQAPKKISLATQKVLERRLSKLTGRGQNPKVEGKRPTAVVRSHTFVAAAPADTCHTAGAAPSGTTRKICRLPMYKV